MHDQEEAERLCRPDRLTRAAWRALGRAALAAGQGPVGPEHLYPALADLRTSVARSALRRLGLDWGALGLPPLPLVSATPGSHARLSPSAAAFLRAAGAEARRLGHHPVGTGHLVLALLAADVGPTPAGLDASRFEAALRDVLGTPGANGPALDGEHLLYLSHDEALVLFAALSRREPRALHAAEAVVLGDLRGLLAPVCEPALRDAGLEPLDAARREVLRLAQAGESHVLRVLPPSTPRAG